MCGFCFVEILIPAQFAPPLHLLNTPLPVLNRFTCLYRYPPLIEPSESLIVCQINGGCVVLTYSKRLRRRRCVVADNVVVSCSVASTTTPPLDCQIVFDVLIYLKFDQVVADQFLQCFITFCCFQIPAKGIVDVLPAAFPLFPNNLQYTLR